MDLGLLALLVLVAPVVVVLFLPLLALVVVLDVRPQPDLGSIVLTLSLLGHRLHAGWSGDFLLPPWDYRLNPGRPAGGGGRGMCILSFPLLLLLLLYVDIPMYERIEQ